jgi:acetyl-CoA carboxylase alpha subunit
MKQTFLDFEQPIAELQTKIDELRYVHEDSAVDISDEINRLQKKSQQLTKEIYGKLRRGRSRRSRGIRSGPTRSTTSTACSASSASCTATARMRTTRRSSAAWRGSTGSRAW